MNLQQRIFLGLGSNLPDRSQHLASAIASLTRDDRFTLLAASRVYETAPLGFTMQTPFLNQALAGLWTGAPDTLLACCQRIEHAAGRERSFPNAPRTLDIDILYWESRTVHTADLIVPHPRLTERAFALMPLLELAPELTDPHTGRPLSSFLTPAMLDQQIQEYEGEAARV